MRKLTLGQINALLSCVEFDHVPKPDTPLGSAVQKLKEARDDWHARSRRRRESRFLATEYDVAMVDEGSVQGNVAQDEKS